MGDIYVISDTHLPHYNMVHKFKTRPFDTVEEMGEVLIEELHGNRKLSD